PVADDLATRFAASLLFASVSLAVALVVGLPAGVAAAVWRGTAWDMVMTARRLDADLLVRADPHRLLLTRAARGIGAGGGRGGWGGAGGGGGPVVARAARGGGGGGGGGRRGGPPPPPNAGPRPASRSARS